MVCSRCEKKMGKLIVPDKWKDGARNANRGTGLNYFPLLCVDGNGERSEENTKRVVRSIEQSRRMARFLPFDWAHA